MPEQINTKIIKQYRALLIVAIIFFSLIFLNGIINFIPISVLSLGFASLAYISFFVSNFLPVGILVIIFLVFAFKKEINKLTLSIPIISFLGSLSDYFIINAYQTELIVSTIIIPFFLLILSIFFLSKNRFYKKQLENLNTINN